MKTRKLKIAQAFLCLCSMFPAIPANGVNIDPESRWQVRDYYQAVYSYGTNLPMNWTGNYLSGDSGTVSGDWLEATRVRVNYFRAMTGIPGSISFDEALNAKCQDAALIMSANNALSHYPPQNWLWWTQDGYDAAGSGNLAFGSAGPRAIDGYMIDHGSTVDPSGNNRVGHRRWVLFPPTTVMGSGDVPGDSSSGQRAANALWVISTPFGPRPQTRDAFIAWPPRGHVPANLVFARWSFGYPDADFSSATVSMQSGGQPIPVLVESGDSGYGDPTLVWRANNMSTAGPESWPVPEIDQPVEVTVSNVLIGGQPQNFSYTVTIIDPDRAGSEEFAHEATLMGKAIITAPAAIQVATRPWAEAVQGRVLRGESYTTLHTAEGGINTLTAEISAGYEPVQSFRVATGSWAFHLANPDFKIQILTIPGEFIIGEEGASLQFASSLAWVTSDQFASVDINTGSGSKWQSIWRLDGPKNSNPGFTNESVDLSPWAGQTARFRFRLDMPSTGSAFTETSPSVGWAFDDVAMAGVTRITSATDLEPVVGKSTIWPVFDSTDPVFVQARSIAFDGVPLDWGPALSVVPEVMTAVNVPVAEWVDDPVLGWMYGSSESWKYNLAMEGYVYVDAFPWLYTTGGWFHYLTGSFYNGFWFYHATHGYGFAPPNYGGFYQLLNQDWKRFTP